jgi:hypothetical protein
VVVNSPINLDDLYPFKFEIKEAIVDYFDTMYKEGRMNASVSRPLVPIMAAYLMYLDLADHNSLKEQLGKLKLKHYIMDEPKEAIEYVHSLPKTLYTMHMYDDPEYTLLKNFGFHVEKTEEYKMILAHIIEFLKKRYPEFTVRI